MNSQIFTLTICILLVLTVLIILITSSKEALQDDKQISSILRPFYKGGARLSAKLCNKRQGAYYRKILEKNSILYSPLKALDITFNYFTEKFALILLTAFVGSIFVIIITLKDPADNQLLSDNTLSRNPSDKKAYDVTLDVTAGNETYKDITITVDEKKLSEEEFYSSMANFCEALEKHVLRDNDSADYVTKNLSFPDSLEGYPYEINWSTDSRHTVSYDGKLWPDKDSSISYEDPAGTIVIISADISYEEYKYLYEFAVNVYPTATSSKDELFIHIMDGVDKAIIDSREDDNVTLPSSVDGLKITWTKQKKSNAAIFLGLIFVLIIAIFFGKDKDISKKIDDRNKQLLDDYPEIVSKLTLLTGAGMSIRNAWKRIAIDYKSSQNELINSGGNPVKRYAYEEMLITNNEMESGVEEKVCLNHFANRIKLQKYVKLASLLEQNSRIGTKSLISDLEAEVKDAFTVSKNNAVKLGEEAGTKLLLPMFMMLLIVMVVIMVPAFCNI